MLINWLETLECVTVMGDREINDGDYRVFFDADTDTIKFTGELALGGPKEYSDINQLLHDVVDTQPEIITIDLTELAFLNSSGISMLSKFVLGFRKKKEIQLTILGSNDIPWQCKSLKNLQNFLPSLRLDVQ